MMLLLAIIVLLNSHPVKHARVSCAEITTFDEDNNGMQGGEMAPTDSAGRMFFSGPSGEYHCSVLKEGVGFWQGTLRYDAKHLSNSVSLISDRHAS